MRAMVHDVREFARFTAGTLVSVLAGLSAGAQADRYELGLRLREFERNLASCTEPARQHASMRELETAVQAFFRLDTRAVAAAIDRADIRLGATEPSLEQRFARSLQLAFAARLVDVGQGTLSFEVSSVFPVETELPQGLRLRIRPAVDAEPLLDMAVTELPCRGELPLTGLVAGDATVEWSLCLGDRVLSKRAQGLSVAVDLQARLAALAGLSAAADELQDGERTIESTTLVALVRMLQGMTRKRAEETVFPGARLLTEAELLASAVTDHQVFYGAARTGEYWLRVPTPTSTAAVRMYAPAVAQGAKQPVVVALHGAGGSENLFFDGYGDGLIVRLAAERSWFVVAPRVGLGTADLPGLVGALASRWPIDRERVVVVGHSMGAAQAIMNTTKAPGLYRAVAALGGGGSVQKAQGLDRLPCFVGVGSRDFARSGAQSLHDRLKDAGAPSTWREYPHVEHLAIVQIALPDVFEFFANAVAAK